MFCFIYYLIQPFCFDLIEISSGDNETTFIICSFKNAYLQRVSALVDTIHRVILPFTLMIVFSTLLVVFICESSKRVAGITKNSTDRRHKHDVKFAISSFSMNLLFILLNLPLSLMNLLIGTPLTSIYLTVYLFYFSYGVNFYVMFITNSIFRKEFFSLFFKPQTNNSIKIGSTTSNRNQQNVIRKKLLTEKSNNVTK
jgi:hypothetical protein